MLLGKLIDFGCIKYPFFYDRNSLRNSDNGPHNWQWDFPGLLHLCHHCHSQDDVHEYFNCILQNHQKGNRGYTSEVYKPFSWEQNMEYFNNTGTYRTSFDFYYSCDLVKIVFLSLLTHLNTLIKWKLYSETHEIDLYWNIPDMLSHAVFFYYSCEKITGFVLRLCHIGKTVTMVFKRRQNFQQFQT